MGHVGPCGTILEAIWQHSAILAVLAVLTGLSFPGFAVLTTIPVLTVFTARRCQSLDFRRLDGLAFNAPFLRFPFEDNCRTKSGRCSFCTVQTDHFDILFPFAVIPVLTILTIIPVRIQNPSNLAGRHAQFGKRVCGDFDGMRVCDPSALAAYTHGA